LSFSAPPPQKGAFAAARLLRMTAAALMMVAERMGTTGIDIRWIGDFKQNILIHPALYTEVYA